MIRRHCLAFLFCILHCFCGCSPVAAQQDYRLVYDSSTIPELYFKTSVALEEHRGNDWIALPPNSYRLSGKKVKLRGNDLSYDPTLLLPSNGEDTIEVQVRGEHYKLPIKLPVLQTIRFNTYTDSIKPVLYYYLNVEGVYSSGRIFPLQASDVSLSASLGTLHDMSWEAPPGNSFLSVQFTATSKLASSIPSVSIVRYRQLLVDPEDGPSAPLDSASSAPEGRVHIAE